MKVGVNFEHLHNPNNQKSVVLWGGRGSGKTHDTIDYFIQDNLTSPYNSVVTRRFDKHVRATFDYFKGRYIDYPKNVRDRVKILSSPMRIVNRVTGSIIFFAGLDNPDNTIKGLPKLNKGWLEEASEGDPNRYFTLYNTIREGINTRLISSFNPVAANNWTKRHFFESGFKSSNYHTTVEDNPFISNEYKQDLRDLKDVDTVRYEVDYLGIWGVLKDLIYFKNVHLIDKIPDLAQLIGSGLDFGISDPTVLVNSYVLGGNIYIEVLINESDLPTTSPDTHNLVAKIKALNIPVTIQADSEDKTSIHTLRAHNVDVLPAIKGKGSIIGGIKKLQSFKNIFILNNQFGAGAYSDFRNYHKTKTPNGIIYDDPANFQEDHTIDSTRYSLSRFLPTF